MNRILVIIIQIGFLLLFLLSNFRHLLEPRVRISSGSRECLLHTALQVTDKERGFTGQIKLLLLLSNTSNNSQPLKYQILLCNIKYQILLCWLSSISMIALLTFCLFLQIKNKVYFWLTWHVHHKLPWFSALHNHSGTSVKWKGGKKKPIQNAIYRETILSWLLNQSPGQREMGWVAFSKLSIFPGRTQWFLE